MSNKGILGWFQPEFLQAIYQTLLVVWPRRCCCWVQWIRSLARSVLVEVKLNKIRTGVDLIARWFAHGSHRASCFQVPSMWLFASWLVFSAHYNCRTETGGTLGFWSNKLEISCWINAHQPRKIHILYIDIYWHILADSVTFWYVWLNFKLKFRLRAINFEYMTSDNSMDLSLAPPRSELLQVPWNIRSLVSTGVFSIAALGTFGKLLGKLFRP